MKSILFSLAIVSVLGSFMGIYGNANGIVKECTNVMRLHEEGFLCSDCHMADVPLEAEKAKKRIPHDFDIANNLPWSCGTYAGGCHSQHKEDWALKHIQAKQSSDTR